MDRVDWGSSKRAQDISLKLFWGTMARQAEVEAKAISRSQEAQRIWTQATNRANAQLVSILPIWIIKENTTSTIPITSSNRWAAPLKTTLNWIMANRASSSTQTYRIPSFTLKWWMKTTTKEKVLVQEASNEWEEPGFHCRSSIIQTSTNSI